MQKRAILLTAVLLFISSFFIRILFISRGPYHLDCLTLLIVSLRSLETGRLHYLHTHGYPLLSILGVLFVKVGTWLRVSDPILSINFISVLFSSLCVPALFFFTKKYLGPATAVFASVLFSVSPIFLGNSVYGNSHAPSLLFLLLSAIILLRYQQSPNARVLITAGIFYGLFASARIQDAVVISLPFSLFFLFSHPNKTIVTSLKKRIQSLSFVYIIALLVTTLFYADIFLTRLKSDPLGASQTILAAGILNSFAGFFSPFYLMLCYRYLLINFPPLGLHLLFVGFTLLLSHDCTRRKGFALLSWFIFPILIYGAMKDVTPRFLMTALIPAYTALGYALAFFFKYKKTVKAGILLVFGILVYMNFFQIQPLLKIRHQQALMPELASWFARMAPQARLIAADERSFFRYYGKISCLGRPFSTGTIPPEALKGFKDNLDKILASGQSVYITHTALSENNYKGQFSKFMKANYHLKLKGWRLTEDWHRGVIYDNRYKEVFFEISPKEKAYPDPIED